MTDQLFRGRSVACGSTPRGTGRPTVATCGVGVAPLRTPRRWIGRAFALASLALSAGSWAAGVPDTLEQRLIACTVCHGKRGEGSVEGGYMPRLSAMPARYLRDQLVSFREGRRHFPDMNMLVSALSDAYLEEIAAYFGNLSATFLAPQPSNLSVQDAARAENLVRRGDASRGIASCTSCHGDALMGVQPAVPGIVGQPRDYLRSQLGAWRSGVRHAPLPDCMATVVAHLADADISVISAWLAARVPALGGRRPAVTFPGPTPLACGATPALQERAP